MWIVEVGIGWQPAQGTNLVVPRSLTAEHIAWRICKKQDSLVRPCLSICPSACLPAEPHTHIDARPDTGSRTARSLRWLLPTSYLAYVVLGELQGAVSKGHFQRLASLGRHAGR